MKTVRILLMMLVLGNCRDNEGDEEENRQFDVSMAKGQDYPILANLLPDERYRILDGHRRAASAIRLGWTEIEAIVVEGELTDAEIRRYQLRTDLHKKKLSTQETVKLIRAIDADNPGMPRVELAELVEMNPSKLSRYLAEVVPSVDTAFFEGRISLSDRYELSQVRPELQEARIALAITGTREQLADQRKKDKKTTPTERTRKIPIHYHIDDENLAVKGLITVAAEPGVEIGLEDAEAILKHAMKLLREAQGKGWSVKSAVNAWKDAAAV